MTPRSVDRRAQADRDVRTSVTWYRREASAAVAERFIDALEETYHAIATDPQIGSTRYAHQLGLEGLRFRVVKGFPYLVFYAEQADRIEVWRVLHAHRDIPAEIEDAPD